MTLREGLEVGGGLEGAVAADRALGPADAGRVDQQPQRAELLGLLDGGHDLLGAGDVDRREDAADLRGELLALVGVEVGDTTFATPRAAS